MSREAMKLALEALEESLGYVEEEAENAQRLYGQYPTRQARIQGLKDDVRKHMHAITALREALADQPAPCEPADDGVCEALDCPNHKPAQQEPVAWLYQHPNNHLKTCYQTYKPNGECVPLYTSPPAQRKPLTDDELADLWYKQSLDWMEFARAIEAKLKEKNT